MHNSRIVVVMVEFDITWFRFTRSLYGDFHLGGVKASSMLPEGTPSRTAIQNPLIQIDDDRDASPSSHQQTTSTESMREGERMRQERTENGQRERMSVPSGE